MGAVSQVDTFDYKPMLIKMHGEEIPALRARFRTTFLHERGPIFLPLVTPPRFSQYGASGAWVSGLFPYTAKIVDDLRFLKTLRTDHVNHDPAAKFFHTGFQLAGRPPEGAWVNYAIGRKTKTCPRSSRLPRNIQWREPGCVELGLGFPAFAVSGRSFPSGKDPVLYVSNPDGVDMKDRRNMLDVIEKFPRDSTRCRTIRKFPPRSANMKWLIA